MSATSINLLRFAQDANELSQVLQPVATPVPTTPLAPNQVRIRMTLRPIDPADVFSILGVYPGFQPKQFPAYPGLEGVGKVEAVASAVSSVQVGQRVMPGLWDLCVQGQGSWQAYMDVDEQDVFPVPDSVSDEAAAQVAINPLTALGMLDRLQLSSGAWLVQSAAGSTLGRQVVAIAKERGINTINLVRRNDSAQINDLKKLGANFVLSTEGKSREEIVQEIKTITQGRGADGAIDAVAGESTGLLASSVKDNGMVLLYGLMSGYDAKLFGPDLMFRLVQVTGFWIAPYLKTLTLAQRQELVEQAFDLFSRGVLDSFLGERYPLDQVAEALAKQNKMGRGGKLFLEN